MAEQITIIVDGFEESVPGGTTLARVIDIHQAQHKDLMAEVNGRFVYPKDYETTVLQQGDRVELVHLAFGG
jgi:thiamine biosynthesis protein ThiS